MKSFYLSARALGVFFAVLLLSAFVLAQSPNTSSVIVTVVDQTGALIPGAKIIVENTATGASREAMANEEGSATFAGLSLTGTYAVHVTMLNFQPNNARDIVLRASETATIKVALQVGRVNDAFGLVTVYGTADGVRTDPIIGKRLDSQQIDETPIIGRKISTLPLLNSAFRQGKGTGDLFVNQTYFITGVGSRRATTFTLDGASNDEGWGRQTAITTVPLGAVQEVNILTNAFSAEYGWTSGPAFNIVTKSGTNKIHGEGLVLFRPGGNWQAKRFSTKNFCPESIPTCTTPATLQSISPIDIPDKLTQLSGAIGGPIVTDETFYFVAADYTRQNRSTFLNTSLPSVVPTSEVFPEGLEVLGRYRQTLLNARIDHRLTDNQNLMVRFNYDRMFDDNPQDAVSAATAPSAARRYSRQGSTFQGNHSWVISSNILNEFRIAYLHGDPVTKWESTAGVSTAYTRGSGNGASPFAIGQSRVSDLWGHQIQFADTLTWTVGQHNVRFGGSISRHTAGGTGNEPGQPLLGTFTFSTTNVTRNTLPFPQLTINDVQNYQQPLFLGVDSYKLSQWLLTGFVQDDWKVRSDLTINLGLRYDRQTLTDAKKNFAPRIGFGWNPGGDARTAIRGGYGMYYTQIRTNLVAGYLLNGLNGVTTYTANPGGVGFPTCLTCVPVVVNPAALPPRDITIIAGMRDFYRSQFAQYGLNFDLLPNYPDKFVNPRSQVFTIGLEREIVKGFFAGADYVHQRVSNLERTVDLNAPTPFDRTAPGQCRSANCNNTASANLANTTRPIVPATGGVRQVNTIMNLGEADYDGLQTQFSYRGHSRFYASVSYTLSKATNTTEPDGNGIGPNESNISRLGEEERGPSVVDQRHRAVILLSYRFPWGFTAGTLSQFATARPFNSTTGVDNNGDGIQNDRPVVDGVVVPKSAFRGSGTQDVSIFVENRIRLNERASLLLRLEGFNIFNHTNMLARGVTTWGNGTTPNPDFGQFVGLGANSTATTAIPAFANIDPPRMFQLQARFQF
jgi:hypothetical protein